MTAWTPGPWEIGESNESMAMIYAPSAKGFVARAQAPNPLDYKTKSANAARIVAAVNACEGMDDPAEAILQLREEITQRVPISTVDGLTDKERELAAALRGMVETAENMANNIDDYCGSTDCPKWCGDIARQLEAARAALSKLEQP